MKTIKNYTILLIILTCQYSIQSQTNAEFQRQISQVDTLIKHKKVNEARDSLNQIVLNFPENQLQKEEQLKLNTVVSTFYSVNLPNQELAYPASKKAIVLSKELYPNDIEKQFKSIINYLINVKAFANYIGLTQFIEENLKEWEAQLGKKSATLSDIYRRLGMSHNALGNFDKGELYLKQALSILALFEKIPVQNLQMGLHFMWDLQEVVAIQELDINSPMVLSMGKNVSIMLI